MAGGAVRGGAVVAACGDDDSSGADDDAATSTSDAAGGDTTPDAAYDRRTARPDDTADARRGHRGPGRHRRPARRRARELIIARDMDLTTLDPGRAYCDTCQIFLTAVYETLIGVDPTDLTVLVPAARRVVGGQRREHRVHVHPRPGRHVRRRLARHRRPTSSSRGSASPASKARRRTSCAGVTRSKRPTTRPSSSRSRRPNSAFLNIVSAPYMGIVSKAAGRGERRHRRRRRHRRAVVPRATRPAADRSCSTRTPRATSWCSPATTPTGARRARSPASPSSR